MRPCCLECLAGVAAAATESTDIGEYHWIEEGPEDAPPMVLVHGFMAHSMAYRRVTHELAQHARLYIVDLPGHGRDLSYQRPGVHPEFESLSRWLRGFRDDVLGDRRAHWVGHSIGADLVYNLAHQEPRSVRSLTLVSPALRIPAQPLTARALKRVPASLAALSATRFSFSLYQPLNWRGEPMTRDEQRRYLAPMRSPDRMKFMLELASEIVHGRHTTPRPLEVPTFVVWGEHDHILPVEDAYWVADRLGVDLHIVEGSGHSPMEDAPPEFARVVSEFIRST